MRNKLARLTNKPRQTLLLLASIIVLSFSFAIPAMAAAGTTCGGPKNSVETSIDIGCKGKGNPITDMLFAFIRFLSAGVGLVIIGSMVWAGIQYTGSRGDPNATALAINRIRSNVIALLLFIFAYALLNYVIPGAFLKS